jgi:hypothetical protein
MRRSFALGRCAEWSDTSRETLTLRMTERDDYLALLGSEKSHLSELPTYQPCDSFSICR